MNATDKSDKLELFKKVWGVSMDEHLQDLMGRIRDTYWPNGIES